MKTINTSDLIGDALDWAVAKCLHRNLFMEPYSTDWSQGGPIIEREKIGYCWAGNGYWHAHQFDPEDELNSAYYQTGPTPLIAAMRCYVASKLGDTVQVPAELA